MLGVLLGVVFVGVVLGVVLGCCSWVLFLGVVLRGSGDGGSGLLAQQRQRMRPRTPKKPSRVQRNTYKVLVGVVVVLSMIVVVMW